jgi:preprotein translocase subunit SecD
MASLVVAGLMVSGCAQAATTAGPVKATSATMSVIVQPADGGELSAAELEGYAGIVKVRAEGAGFRVESVSSQPDGSVVVVVDPLQATREAILDSLVTGGNLEFVEVASLDESVQESLAEGYVMKPGSYKAFLTGSVVRAASASESGDKLRPGYVVNLSFDATGTAIWGAVTARAATTQERIAIVIDGIVVSAPSVVNAIPDGNVEIGVDFTIDEAKRLATNLQAGAIARVMSVVDVETPAP